jgi:uncharacterized protein
MKLRAAIGCFLFLCVGSTYALGQSSQSPTSQPPSGAPAGQPSASPSSAGATASGPGAPTTPPKIDPAKEADIRQLLNLVGGTAAINQVMDGMQTNMKASLANLLPPGAYREQLVNLFFEKFRSKADISQLIDIAVQVYDKYLSDDDVKGLIQFYSTPLGKKTLSILPKVTVEMQNSGLKWGQDLGRESMQEVLASIPKY